MYTYGMGVGPAWVRLCTVKDTAKDYVPVDTLIDTDKLLILLMFRSVMAHVLGTYVFFSRTINPPKTPENAQFFACFLIRRDTMEKGSSCYRKIK